MSEIASTDMVGQVGGRRGTVARGHHVCVVCRERRSLFRYRGVVKADHDHILCFQCHRALHDTMRARQMASRVFAAA